MNKNFDIEDLFSNSFNGFETNPSNSAWDSIENSLNNSFPETTYFNKFKDYTMQPSNKAWRGIAGTLWFDSFMKFSLNKFNIYYAASIVAAIFLLFNFTNIIPNNNDVIAENQLKNLNIANSANNNDIVPKTNTKNTNPVIITVNDDTTKQTNKNNAVVVKNNNINNNTIEQDYYDESFSDKNNIKIVNNYITDTIRLRDTILLRDTVFMEAKNDPLAFVASPWSMDAYYNPLYSSSFYNGPSDILNSIDEHTSNAYSWSLGLNVNYKINNFSLQTGLALTKFSEKFDYYKESIDINKYSDRVYSVVGEYTHVDKYTDWVITTMHNVPVIDTISSSYEISHTEYNGAIIIDTIWSYETDTIMVHVYDSVQVVYYDTVTALKYDTVDVVVIDTIKTRSFYEFVNRYTYMEVPLIVNYELKHNKFSYVFGGGVITGIFLNAQGKGISTSNEVVSLNDLPFMKLNISGVVNAGVHYHLNPKISILFEGVYRRNFNSIYNNSYFLEQRFNSFGLRLGMRYRF